MNHKLHKTIGKIIKEYFSDGFEVILDRACGGKQNIPLFSSRRKSRETEICDVDILILKNGKVKVIFEIEESHSNPTQICGKYLTSALSSCYISRNNKTHGMDKSVLFIQILDSSGLRKDKTKKIEKWDIIEKAIGFIVPIKQSNIKKYKILHGETDDFETKKEGRTELINLVKRFLYKPENS